jgi:PAS domain S-box-containing protein
MENKLFDLIDFDKVNNLFEGFNISTGFVTAILDLEGNVISKSGWRELCTGFHRINPETSKRCTISDTILAGKMAAGEKYHFYKCLNGLVDVAVPIVINDEHIANLFTGQFFFEKPDIQFFKKQASKYGFDEEKYLEALSKVPVVSEERVKRMMDFLLDLAELIIQMSVQQSMQKELNNALKESEKRYRLISEVASDYMFSSKVDESGRLILNWAAGAFESITGYTFEEYKAVGGWRATVHPDDLEKDDKDMEALSENKDVVTELRTYNKKGEVVWVRVYAHPVFDEVPGKLMGIYGAVQNITEQKQAETALNESQRLMYDIIEFLPDATFAINREGKVIAWNRAIELITGVEAKNILGKGNYEYAIPFYGERQPILVDFVFEDLKEVVKNYVFIKYEGNSIVAESNVSVLNGELRYLFGKASPLYDVSGNVIGAIESIRDITEQKKDESILRESEEKYRTFFQNSIDAVLLTSPDGKIFKANPSACKMLGRTEEEICRLGRNYLVDINDPRLQQFVSERAKNGHARGELTMFRNDNTPFPVEVSSAIYKDKNGVILASMIVHDISERKKAEAILKYQQEILDEMGRVAKIGGWEFDADTGKGTWTEETARIHDLDPNDPANVEIGISFYTDESRAKIENAIKEAIEKVKPYDLELELVSAKGNHKWVRTIGNPKTKNGKVVKVRGSFQDITEIVLAEKALKVSEEKFAKAFEVSPDSIVLTTMDTGRIFDANKSFTRLFGYTKEEYIDKTTLELNIWTNRQEREEFVARLKEQGKIENMVFHFRTKSGEKRYCYLSSEYFYIDGEECMLTILHDYTDLKLSQTKTENERIRLRTLIETIPDIVWLKDKDGKFLFCNKEFEKLVGAAESEILGKTDYDFLSKEQAELFRNVDQKVIETKKASANIEKLVYKNDLHEALLETIKSPMYDASGVLIGVLGVSRDVTELYDLNQNLEKKVAERTRQLQAVNKELETFSYSVSHDLKAPLRGIDGYSKLLQELYAGQLNDEAKHFINTIRSSTRQMNQLIEDLLSYSRLERATLKTTSFMIKPFVDNLKSFFASEINEHNTFIVFNIPDVEIAADQSGLNIILRNLFSNALKFSGKADSPKIEISMAEKESSWLLSVGDNGIGFDMKYHDRIFEIFQRLNLPEHFTGTGIGLAMVKKAAQRMGGDVWAESKPGEGAIFYFEIPKSII